MPWWLTQLISLAVLATAASVVWLYILLQQARQRLRSSPAITPAAQNPTQQLIEAAALAQRAETERQLWLQLAESRRELAEARRELSDSRRELAVARQEISQCRTEVNAGREANLDVSRAATKWHLRYQEAKGAYIGLAQRFNDYRVAKHDSADPNLGIQPVFTEEEAERAAEAMLKAAGAIVGSPLPTSTPSPAD